MIVCHCNVLTTKNVLEAVEQAGGRDGLSLVTPGLVFKKNAKRPRCGYCMAHIHQLIEDHMKAQSDAEKQETVGKR